MEIESSLSPHGVALPHFSIPLNGGGDFFMWEDGIDGK